MAAFSCSPSLDKVGIPTLVFLLRLFGVFLLGLFAVFLLGLFEVVLLKRFEVFLLGQWGAVQEESAYSQMEIIDCVLWQKQRGRGA